MGRAWIAVLAVAAASVSCSPSEQSSGTTSAPRVRPTVPANAPSGPVSAEAAARSSECLVSLRNVSALPRYEASAAEAAKERCSAASSLVAAEAESNPTQAAGELAGLLEDLLGQLEAVRVVLGSAPAGDHSADQMLRAFAVDDEGLVARAQRVIDGRGAG